MKLLFGTAFAIISMMGLAGSANAECLVLMRSAEYQTEFHARLTNKQYPETVVAEVVGGEVVYSPCFSAYPSDDFEFYAHHGFPDSSFTKRSDELKAQGFHLKWHQRVELSGRGYNQGLWVR